MLVIVLDILANKPGTLISPPTPIKVSLVIRLARSFRFCDTFFFSNLRIVILASRLLYVCLLVLVLRSFRSLSLGVHAYDPFVRVAVAGVGAGQLLAQHRRGARAAQAGRYVRPSCVGAIRLLSALCRCCRNISSGIVVCLGVDPSIISQPQPIRPYIHAVFLVLFRRDYLITVICLFVLSSLLFVCAACRRVRPIRLLD